MAALDCLSPLEHRPSAPVLPQVISREPAQDRGWNAGRCGLPVGKQSRDRSAQQRHRRPVADGDPGGDTVKEQVSAGHREIVQVLTEIPVGVESGWHIHPGEEVGYILAGTVQMMIQGQPTLTLHAGDPFLMPPGTPHNALDVGPATGHMLSTYIVETGRPLATFVDGPPVSSAAPDTGIQGKEHRQ